MATPTRHVRRRRDGLSARYIRVRAHLEHEELELGYDGRDPELEWPRRWSVYTDAELAAACDDRDSLTRSIDNEDEWTWVRCRQRLEAHDQFTTSPFAGLGPRAAADPRPEPEPEAPALPEADALEAALLDYLGRCDPGGTDNAPLRLELIEARPGFDADLRALVEIDIPELTTSMRTTLVLTRPFWLRRPASFAGRTVLDLVRHLLVHYPVPAWLLHAWRTRPTGLHPRWVAWLVALGQGLSLRRLSQRAVALGLPQWPALAKGACAYLFDAPPTIEPDNVLTYLELRRAGGSLREYRWLVHNASYRLWPRPRAGQLHADGRSAAFWRATVRWLAAHGARLTGRQAAAILGWARHEHIERARRKQSPLAWADYDAGRALEAARAYEREVFDRRRRPRDPPPRPRPKLRWKARGLGWKTTRDELVWEFRELVSTAELQAESEAMRHCVRSYDQSCAKGRCVIVSLRCEGKRRLTIEVRPAIADVVQVRGRFNRLADPDEAVIIAQWRAAVVRRM